MKDNKLVSYSSLDFAVNKLIRASANHDDLVKTLGMCVSYLADLNGSKWIAGDGPGEKDMRQQAKALQKIAYESLKKAKA